MLRFHTLTSNRRYRWLSTFMVGMAVVALLAVTVATRTVQGHLVASIGESVALAARDIAAKLDTLQRERQGDLQVLQTISTIYGHDATASHALLTTLAAAHGYRWLALTDAEGRIMESTEAAMVGLDCSRDAWFQAARGLSGIDVRFVSGTQDPASSRGLAFSARTLSPGQEVLGVVTAWVGLETLNNLIQRTVQGIELQEFPTVKIEYQLVGEDGLLLADSLPAQQPTANLKIMGLQSVMRATHGEAGYLLETDARRGVPVVTGYARTTGLAGVPATQWVILVRVDRGAILAPIQSLMTRLGLLFAAVFAPMLGFLVWSTRRLRTDWLRAEESSTRARAAEAKYRALLQSTGDGIYGIDIEGRCTFINRAGAQMLGYEPDELLGLDMHETIHQTRPDSSPYPIEDCPIHRAIGCATGCDHDEDVFWRRDRSSFPVRCSAEPLVTENGVVGAVVVFSDITERKQIQEELRRQQEYTAHIVNSAPMLVCGIRPDGATAFVNHAVTQTTGYGAGELIGQNWWRLFYPGDEYRQVERLFHEFEQGPVVDYEMTLTTKYGDKRVVAWNSVNRYSESGELVEVIGIGVDVTERRRVEAALRASEAQYQTLATISPVGIFHADDKGLCLYVNRRWCEIAGLSLIEACGEGWIRALHPEDRTSVLAEWRAAVQEDRPFRSEYRIQRPDGAVTWVFGQAVAQRGPGDEIASFVGTITDISQRKEAEEAVRKSQARLAEAQRIAHLGNWDWDILKNQVWWSDEVYRIFGLAPQQFGATYEALLASVHPEDRDAVNRAVEQALTHRQPYSIDHRILLPDGTVRFVHAQAEVTYDEAASPVRMAGTVQDITIHRGLEEQLRQAQKIEAIGRLAGGIAHDFNNLLTVINGYSHLALTHCRPEDPTRDAFEQIKLAGKRAATLTQQLLAFSRRQVFEAKVLDPNAVVENAEKLLRHLIGEDIELITFLDPNVGLVRADQGQLDQVIMNLAVNARDAMPQGGKLTVETRNVELSAAYVQTHFPAKPGRYVMLAVTDTGCGMDAETQSHIFEPFFTTKEPGKGTGLGLATVYGIVKQSEGYIRVYSEQGVGTSFKIYLPRVEDEAEPEESLVVSASVAQGTETVLLVEDEAMVRRLARKVLAQHGYKVLEACDGEEALSLAAQHPGPIDLLLTDTVMPKLSGREVASRLAARFPDLKVVFMSGYTDDAVVRHGVLEAGVPFLQKPFTPDALACKLRDVLDGRTKNPSRERLCPQR